VFEGTVGQVLDKEFEIHAKIDPAKSDRAPKSAPLGYGKNLPESIQKGIEDTLDKEAAEGILRFLPKGMTASAGGFVSKNILDTPCPKLGTPCPKLPIF
jgi:hypothetical protein